MERRHSSSHLQPYAGVRKPASAFLPCHADVRPSKELSWASLLLPPGVSRHLQVDVPASVSVVVERDGLFRLLRVVEPVSVEAPTDPRVNLVRQDPAAELINKPQVEGAKGIGRMNAAVAWDHAIRPMPACDLDPGALHLLIGPHDVPDDAQQQQQL